MVKPPVEPVAWARIFISPSAPSPVSVTLTYVALFARGVKRNSTVLGLSSSHSKWIRLSSSISYRKPWWRRPYISDSAAPSTWISCPLGSDYAIAR